jgi:hypothetical protein
MFDIEVYIVWVESCARDGECILCKVKALIAKSIVSMGSGDIFSYIFASLVWANYQHFSKATLCYDKLNVIINHITIPN